jgi:hypothetical protein
MDQSLCLANQRQGATIRSYLLHSSLASVIGLGVLCHSPASANSARMQEQNNFAEANWHVSTGAKKNQLLGLSTLRLTIQASFAPLVY